MLRLSPHSVLVHADSADRPRVILVYAHSLTFSCAPTHAVQPLPRRVYGPSCMQTPYENARGSEPWRKNRSSRGGRQCGPPDDGLEEADATSWYDLDFFRNRLCYWWLVTSSISMESMWKCGIVPRRAWSRRNSHCLEKVTRKRITRWWYEFRQCFDQPHLLPLSLFAHTPWRFWLNSQQFILPLSNPGRFLRFTGNCFKFPVHCYNEKGSE
jgi:hypothetical protein